MKQDEIEQQIATFLAKSGGIESGSFTTDEEIFSNGKIDSYTTLELTIFIEDEFGVEVDQERIAHLGSIGRTAACIVQAAGTRRQDA